MERKIGEVFQDGEVTLKVEKSGDSCVGCYYDKFKQCPNSRRESSCVDYERSDDTPVIFTQITQ